MFLTNRKNIFRNNTFISLLLFFILSTLWLWQFHGYQTIRYLEEVQLFRTDSLYFQSFLSQPAGLINYIGAFLTQFFHYPFVGALIISGSIAIIYLLFYFICKKEGDIGSLFILLYPAPVLFLISCNRVFRESFFISVILVLLLFLFYLYIPRKPQPLCGIFLFTICWFIAGSFSFLLAILLFIHYLKNGNKSIIYIPLLISFSLLIPYISYHYLYITSWEKLTLWFSTLDRIYPNKLYISAILSIPVIYSLWIFYLKNKVKEFPDPTRILFFYYAILVCSMIGSFIFITDISGEKKAQIAYEINRGNWDKVLTISRSYVPKHNQEDGQAIACFTNLALLEKDQLLESMFLYYQPGTSGLFPSRKRDYSGYMASSEIYYWLGLIPEAEHLAFEALVISTGKHGSKPVKRLVETNALRRDTACFEKYTKLLLQSPIHRKWAKKEREEFYSIQQIDKVTGKPSPLICEDFFVNYTLPEYNLIGLFRSDETNKKIYEYLLGSLLLNKDMDNFTKFLNRYWQEPEYKKLPLHIEEAILLCRYILGIMDDNQIKSYPVSEKRKQELMEFSVAVNKGGRKENIKAIKNNFGTTFWHYYYFTEPVKYQSEPEIPRY